MAAAAVHTPRMQVYLLKSGPHGEAGTVARVPTDVGHRLIAERDARHPSVGELTSNTHLNVGEIQRKNAEARRHPFTTQGPAAFVLTLPPNPAAPPNVDPPAPQAPAPGRRGPNRTKAKAPKARTKSAK